MKKCILYGIAFAAIITSCTQNSKKIIPTDYVIKSVKPVVETDAVNAIAGEDAADDACIYLHPDGNEHSWIIGTNKRSGLCIYNLKGKELYYSKVGLVNNVDLLYDFPLGNGQKVDLVAASNRSNNSITVLKINPDKVSFDTILTSNIISAVDEVYGFCMYVDQENQRFYAMANGKDGNIEQWELLADGKDKISAELRHNYKVETQPEGMVVDAENGYLYVGEEIRGIWRFELLSHERPRLVQNSDSLNQNIVYDVEGLTMFYGSKKNSGYLIASSQGNFTYAVFNRMPPNRYLGSFKLVDNGAVDGTQETDGIDVLNVRLNDTFQHGIFIAQDGFNYEGDSLTSQNFKMVPWERIAQQFEPNLIIE